ncbi:MAG: hypothetical protein P4L79_16520 [Legionella sp.]|uniref:hypothetical protein n=1 Tax=Legionella sp. TaxID=459 RepID=UPI00283C5346|nr:hypothetical protein [Legionella sp.]
MPFINSNNEIFNDETTQKAYSDYKKSLYAQSQDKLSWITLLDTVVSPRLKKNDIHYDALNALINSMKTKGLLATEVLLPIQIELFEYTLKRYPLITEKNREAAIQSIGHLNNILFNTVLENHILAMEDAELMHSFIAVPSESIETKLRKTYSLVDEALISGLMTCRQHFVILLGEHLLHLANTHEIAAHLAPENQASLISRLDGIKLAQEKSKTVSDLERTLAELKVHHIIFTPQLKKGLMDATIEMNLALDTAFSEAFLAEGNLNNLNNAP